METDSTREEKTSRFSAYLGSIGVPRYPPRSSPIDPGYDPATVASHLSQSHHLMLSLKLSMACWQIGSEEAIRSKVAAAKRCGVPTCTGGGPFEVAATFGCLEAFLELCAEIGFDRIEAGEGFTHTNLSPVEIVKAARAHGLELQYEVGEKHAGPFTDAVVERLLDQARAWLDAGAEIIVVEARESAQDVGLFGQDGEFAAAAADRFVAELGMPALLFEAPTKRSQFALLTHFGPEVQLANVRLEELLRVEIYRRGLHSDAFRHANLRPGGPPGR